MPMGPKYNGLDTCKALIHYDQRCASTAAAASNACAVARNKECGKYAIMISDAFMQGVQSCSGDNTVCGDLNGCVDTLLASATHTATQVKVRNDYCTTCGADAGPMCPGEFFRITPDGVGPGYLVIQLSDPMLADVDAKCTGKALDLSMPGTCRDAFLACASAVAQNAAPMQPPECMPPMPQPMGDAGQ
jgi:hypothetical protein